MAPIGWELFLKFHKPFNKISDSETENENCEKWHVCKKKECLKEEEQQQTTTHKKKKKKEEVDSNSPGIWNDLEKKEGLKNQAKPLNVHCFCVDLEHLSHNSKLK